MIVLELSMRDSIGFNAQVSKIILKEVSSWNVIFIVGYLYSEFFLHEID